MSAAAVGDEFLSNARALVQLRAALGDELFNEQIQQLVDDFVARTPSVAAAAPTLAAAHKDGCLDSKQIAQISQLLMMKSKSTSASASASSSSSSSVAIAPTPSNFHLKDEKASIASINPPAPAASTSSSSSISITTSSSIKLLSPSAALLDALSMLSIETVQDALALMKNHTDNRALDQLLAPDLVREFELFAETKLAQLDVVRAPRELSRRLFHLADDRASILLLPLDNNEVHLYAELETEAPGGANQGEDAEAVLFVVDVSASMNHDERGSYLAPNSLDHRASSIAKARALVEPLVLASLRRGASVAVVPWNFEAMPAIRFRPPPAAAAAADDEQAPDALDDVALRAEIRVRCGSDAFRAHGATNIEAALERSLDLAREATLRPNAGWTHVTLFLLTDGDETIYLDQNRKPQRVPTDPNHAQFAHFNHVGEGGTTAYQRQLCAMMARGKQDLLAHRCQLDVHVCGVGEAPTQFLRALREAVNGHFHALADVARLADEMRAAGLVRGGDGEPVVIGDEQCVRIGALYDAEVGALCARTTVSPAVAWRLVSARDDVGTAVLFRGSRSTVRCVARDETSDAIRETATRVLTFERRLGAAIDRLRHEQITRNAVRDAMDMIGAVRRERDEAVATLARAVRRRSLLQRFLQAVLAGAETQLAALERLLARYHAPAAAQFDASAAERARAVHGARSAGNRRRSRVGARAHRRAGAEPRRATRRAARGAARSVGARHARASLPCGARSTTPPPAPRTLRLRVGAGAQAPDVAPLVELQCSTEALDECATRLLDPLSFASFLDTIADADTLPSALYVIAADQPPGVLFEQQETLWIKSGGLEVTTLDYFRLFAKLHGRDVDGTPRPVRVPGTFADANFALPLAPDRLTIEVLVQDRRRQAERAGHWHGDGAADRRRPVLCRVRRAPPGARHGDGPPRASGASPS
jgi:hypothetical protein